MYPQHAFRSVVLPDPLGPISAVIRPDSTSTPAPLSARTPPKRFDTPFASSTALVPAARAALARRNSAGSLVTARLAAERADESCRSPSCSRKGSYGRRPPPLLPRRAKADGGRE